MSPDTPTEASLACRACGSAEHSSYVWSAASDAFYFCERCGSGFTHPGLQADQIDAFYKNEYRKIFTSEAMGFSRRLFFATRNDLEIANQRVLAVEATIPVGGAVWEIGSGYGAFLSVLSQRRPDLRIIASEPDAKAREAFPVGANVAFATNEDAASCAYDAIFAFHVFEHVTSPQDFLLMCKKSLRPNGFVTISVPDYSKITRDRMFVHKAHLSYFTASSLAFVVKQAGFDVTSCVSTDVWGPEVTINASNSPSNVRAVDLGDLAAVDLQTLQAVEISAAYRVRRFIKALGVQLLGVRLLSDLVRLKQLTTLLQRTKP